MSVQSHYYAFLSYSHGDRQFVARLHRQLENFRLPVESVGRDSPAGPLPARLRPVFRDREELPVSPDLGERLIAALQASTALVVICSPRAAQSRWVNEEILTFKRLHGEARIFPIIVAGSPNASRSPGREAEECFPHALRFHLDPQGELSDRPTSPIAADVRRGADGFRLAVCKLIAGITGIPLDRLVRRDAQRRLRILSAVTAASLLAVVVTASLALYANARRLEAIEFRRRAEHEAAAARATSEFLVSTFQLASPATENPRNITAQSILANAAERARLELAAEPDVQLRLLETVARAYNNLGLLGDARATLQPLAAGPLPNSAAGARALLTLATSAFMQSDFAGATSAIALAERSLQSLSSPDPEQQARALELRGRIAEQEGDLEPALRHFDAALALDRAAPGVPPEELARVLNNRGLLLADMGRDREAEESLLEANRIWRGVYGDGHRVVGQSYYALAQNALIANRLDAAQAYIRQSLTILDRVLEPNNVLLGDAVSMQGQIYEEQKKFPEARAALRRSVDIYRRSFGGPHFSIGIAEVYLALVESGLGHTETALKLLDDAKVNYDASYGKLNVNHGDLLVNRARILDRAGRRPAAHADCAAGLDIIRQTIGADTAFYRTNVDICASLDHSTAGSGS